MPLDSTDDDSEIDSDVDYLDLRKIKNDAVRVQYNKIRIAQIASLSQLLALLLDLLDAAKDNCAYGDYPQACFILAKYHHLDQKSELLDQKNQANQLYITSHAVTRWDKKIAETHAIFFAHAQKALDDKKNIVAAQLLQQCSKLTPDTKTEDLALKELHAALQNELETKPADTKANLLANSISKSGVISAAASSKKLSAESQDPPDNAVDCVSSRPHRPGTPVPF